MILDYFYTVPQISIIMDLKIMLPDIFIKIYGIQIKPYQHAQLGI